MLIDIEIATEHSRQLRAKLLHLLLDKLGALQTGNNSDMIHVEVEIEELSPCRNIAEMTPRANTDTGGIPTKTWTVGGFREPEIAMFDYLKKIDTIEDGRMFTCLFAIVSSGTYTGIPRQLAEHIVELIAECLLRTEDLELVEAY